MGLFSKHLKKIRQFVKEREESGLVRGLPFDEKSDWPVDREKNLVLAQDTGVELGHPDKASVSFLIWDENLEAVKDGEITLIGQDLEEGRGKSLPFGKIIIAGIEGFDAENSYERYREMDGLRYSLKLKGYMLRAVSQYQREWSRVGSDALDAGFGFQTLGSSLIKAFRGLSYIRSVETIFITSSREDIMALRGISGEVMTIISAMNKMLNELSFDCDSCEYLPVCDEVTELRSMRKALNGNVRERTGSG